MLYMVQAQIDPVTGTEVEGDPERMESVLGSWQALNPIGMYASMTRRELTVIVEAPNEDSLFEALHATWTAAKTYPTVTPVVTMDEFPGMMQRAGLGPQ